MIYEINEILEISEIYVISEISESLISEFGFIHRAQGGEPLA